MLWNKPWHAQPSKSWRAPRITQGELRHSRENSLDGVIVNDFCAQLHIRCHDVVCTLGNNMNNTTLLFPPADRARLQLAAYSISLYNESGAVLVGVLSKGNCTISFSED